MHLALHTTSPLSPRFWCNWSWLGLLPGPWEICIFFKYSPKDIFHYFFRKRGRGRKRNSDERISWLLLIGSPPRDWTHNLGMCPDQESSPQTFSVQDNAPTNWAILARVWALGVLKTPEGPEVQPKLRTFHWVSGPHTSTLSESPAGLVETDCHSPPQTFRFRSSWMEPENLHF